MQFNRRNINKKLRNGDIISSSLYYSSSSGGGSSSGGVLSGNYLPATQNPDGTLLQVKFQLFVLVHQVQLLVLQQVVQLLYTMDWIQIQH